MLACVRASVQMDLVLLLVTDSIDDVEVAGELGSCRFGVLLVCGVCASCAVLGYAADGGDARASMSRPILGGPSLWASVF